LRNFRGTPSKPIAFDLMNSDEYLLQVSTLYKRCFSQS
jgi:hypothetical protein